MFDNNSSEAEKYVPVSSVENVMNKASESIGTKLNLMELSFAANAAAFSQINDNFRRMSEAMAI